jgi:hypothetical protein
MLFTAQILKSQCTRTSATLQNQSILTFENIPPPPSPPQDLKTPGAAQQAADMGGGSMLFVLSSEEWTGANSVYLSGWRGTAQLTLFVSKVEAQALSHKVLGTSKADEKAEQFADKQEAPEVINGGS